MPEETTVQHGISWIFAAITGLGGATILLSEIGYKLVYAFGFHGMHGCGELWGLWSAILWSAVLFLSSAAYSSGTPTKTGRDMLNALVSRIKSGDGL